MIVIFANVLCQFNSSKINKYFYCLNLYILHRIENATVYNYFLNFIQNYDPQVRYFNNYFGK